MGRQVRVVEGCSTKIIDNPHPTPPARLYAVLFRELCSVDTGQMTITQNEGNTRDGRVAEGYFGNERAGVRWVESGSGMTPMYVQHTSYGLPGMELRWRYQWHRGEQGAYNGYQHLRLEVTFEDEAAVDQFTVIWRRVFGWQPILLDEASPLAQTMDDNLTQQEKYTLAKDPETSGAILLWLATIATPDVDKDLLRTVARNPSTAPSILETLIDHRSEALDDAIAQNPHTDGDMLREIYRRQHERIYINRRYWLIAAHRNTPPDILQELARLVENIQHALNHNPNAPKQ